MPRHAILSPQAQIDVKGSNAPPLTNAKAENVLICMISGELHAVKLWIALVRPLIIMEGAIISNVP